MDAQPQMGLRDGAWRIKETSTGALPDACTACLNLAFDVNLAVRGRFGSVECSPSFRRRESDCFFCLGEEVLSSRLADEFAAFLVRFKGKIIGDKPQVYVWFIPVQPFSEWGSRKRVAWKLTLCICWPVQQAAHEQGTCP